MCNGEYLKRLILAIRKSYGTFSASKVDYYDRKSELISLKGIFEESMTREGHRRVCNFRPVVVPVVRGEGGLKETLLKVHPFPQAQFIGCVGRLLQALHHRLHIAGRG